MIYEEEDVAGVSTIEDELGEITLDQVRLGSCTFQTLTIGGAHMKIPHEAIRMGITCVSLEILEDGPYAGMGKGSFLM